MPQMAPIWWTIMFTIFTLSMIFMLVKMYFSATENKSVNKALGTISLKNILNWMW